MKRKKSKRIRSLRVAHVGDLVHAWDRNKPQAMDASDDDGHVIGYIQVVGPDYTEVGIGGHTIKCWSDPIVVIQRFAARVRYYLDEKLMRYHCGSSAEGGADAWDEVVYRYLHGPYSSPATARSAMRFLSDDRLKHSGIKFQKVIKNKDDVFFGQSEGSDRELSFTVISRLEVRDVRPKPQCVAKTA